jgi:hypothetical protein
MTFFEIAKDSDVRQSEGGSAAQRNSNPGPVRIATIPAHSAGRTEKPRRNSANQNPITQSHGRPRAEANLGNAFGYMRIESDLPVFATGLGPNLKRKCRELLFGKANRPLSAILIIRLQEDHPGFGPVDESIHANRPDGRVQDVERVIRLVDDGLDISNNVPEMGVHRFSLVGPAAGYPERGLT